MVIPLTQEALILREKNNKRKTMMKLNKLLETLLLLKETHGGDIDIRVEADHGQTAMSLTWVGLGHVEEIDAYMTESIHPDDVDEDSFEVILLQGY
jgi:hypothetical protein